MYVWFCGMCDWREERDREERKHTGQFPVGAPFEEGSVAGFGRRDEGSPLLLERLKSAQYEDRGGQACPAAYCAGHGGGGPEPGLERYPREHVGGCGGVKTG